MDTDHDHAPPRWRQAPLTRALEAAGIAFFDYRPDWDRDASGYSGAWHWSGARFGIAGVDSAADGASALVDAAAEDDLAALLEALSLERAEVLRAAEFRLERPGEAGPHLLCEVQCDTGPDGRPAALFGTIQDITPQRRGEAALIENARRDHVVLAAIDFWPVGISIADATQPGLPLIYVNRLFSRMTGYESGEVIGRDFSLPRGPATDPRVLADIAEAIARGARAEARLVCYRKDGTPFLNRVILDPIHGQDGQLIAYMGSHADITLDAEQEEAAAREESAARARLMGEVAHRINDMLQPVTLLAQDAIDKGLVAEAGRGHLDILLECSTKARHIIGERLALARAAPRRVEVHDPVLLLHESLRLVRQAIPAGLALRVRVAGQPPPVLIDRTIFSEILLNLATNAAAAATRPRGELAITLDEESGDGNRGRFARLRVIEADRAAAADGEAAFEPFFTTKPDGLGTGLGFPVVRGLVREIGGTITLAREAGGGMMATVLIPGHAAAMGGTLHAGH